ncbi:putative reverse transcriptase zinc-binding domain-containing protein [Helianthus anomalus]
MDRLPTAAALSRRGIVLEDQSCPFCSDYIETVEHVFTACRFASILWQNISSWCKVPNMFSFSFKDLLELKSHSGLSGKKAEIFHGLVIIGCWCLWRLRNNIRFNNKVARMEDVISEVRSCGFLWAKNRAKLTSLSWSDWCKFVNM